MALPGINWAGSMGQLVQGFQSSSFLTLAFHFDEESSESFFLLQDQCMSGLQWNNGMEVHVAGKVGQVIPWRRQQVSGALAETKYWLQFICSWPWPPQVGWSPIPEDLS